MPNSCSYSPLVKKRSDCWPPEICVPAFARRPVPRGVVFLVDHRLKLVRLSDTQSPDETCDSNGFRQLAGEPGGAGPHSVFAVGFVLMSLMIPGSALT